MPVIAHGAESWYSAFSGSEAGWIICWIEK